MKWLTNATKKTLYALRVKMVVMFLATREVWAKPVAKTDDGRWVFETEYGLEYLDFEDYEFEPEFDSFEDEESLVDFD